MPLLKKKAFSTHTITNNLKDDEEVFYCEITNEIFRDYEEFSERMFLYNSMVWTCCMTGKQNLTYQEALESEDHAKQSLKEFPIELRLPVLYLANKTHRTSFADMADDVFNFVKDRYFIGENLETSFTGAKWKDSHVLQVISPSENVINDSLKNGNKAENHFFPPANLFKYEIEHLDADDNDISEIMIVDCNQIRRRKGSFNRDKCKLFIKQYVEHDSKGIFVIKPTVIEELGINRMKFEQIFDGPLPNFEVSKRKERVPNGKKKLNQETLAKYLTKMNGDNTTSAPKKNGEKKVNLLGQMKKREEEFKKNQQVKDEERKALKKKQKQDSVLLNNSIKKWLQPKEDTQLENQKKLPQYMPVVSKVPEKYFGDMLMVMEFIDSFSKILSTKDFFPGGVTLELMERALTEKEVAGPLTDIIQMLLTALFNVQDEESNQYRTSIENAADIKDEDVFDHLSLTNATRLATMASSWSSRYQGFPLGRLPLYSVTVSEILRLHLLSSGARINETGQKWRYAERGGYTSEDDPGLHLRLHQPHILKSLATHNVVQLTIEEKLQILDCLMNQLLTYADIRDIVEERLDKLKQQKNDLKAIQLIEKKREQEHVAAKQKLHKELKAEPEKLKESLEKLESSAERKQVDNSRKISKLMKSIYDGQPLMGTDRAYRRYLKLESVPGVFINDEELHAGVCNESICPQDPDLVNANRQYLLKHMRKIYIDNKQVDPTKSPTKVNGDLDSSRLIVDEDFTKSLLMCTANPLNCPVHSTSIERTKWSFIYDELQLAEVEDSLNKRGIREGELLQAIQNDKERLGNIISQMPGKSLNPNVEMKEATVFTRNDKKIKDRYEDSNLGYPSTMTPDEVLENALIDNILEMEEKIFAGSLGLLPVKNREEWRQCLSNKKYDDMSKNIVKRERNKLVKTKKLDKNNRPITPENTTKQELKDYQDPGRFLGTNPDCKVNGIEDENECPLIASDNFKESITCLAISLAQVAQAVDAKYLKKPLGAADVTKNDKNKDVAMLDKWEQSLMASTSYSQVFLHYGTLDSCVMWSRSALLARCRICRRQKDSENMLLCDDCNLGHHLYCLKPKLTSIPKGDWFCDRCKKEKEKQEKLLSPQPTPTKKRRIFRDEDIEDEEEVSSGNGCDQLEVELNDDEDEQCSEEESDIENDGTNGDVKFDLCKTCGSGGEMISCEKCSTCFHIECCEPPLRRAPRGPWTCHLCKGPKHKDRRRDSESSDEVSLTNRRTHRRDDIREDLPLHNVALQELLGEVMRHADAWAFIRPVQKTEVPDYYDVITKPMDFGTIKYKLNMGKYSNDSQLMEDVVLVFENCNTYNDSDAEVYKCGMRLLKFFEKKAKELGLKIPEEMMSEDSKPPKKKRRVKE